MDQCQHCRVRGDMAKCRAVPCSVRLSWFAAEAEVEIDRLRTACECVVATAHGNTYGLTQTDVTEARMMAERSCEEALGAEAVRALLDRHGAT